jgi:hypothetical protein
MPTVVVRKHLFLIIYSIPYLSWSKKYLKQKLNVTNEGKVSKFNLTSDPSIIFYLVNLLKNSESVVSSFIIEKSNFEFSRKT